MDYQPMTQEMQSHLDKEVQRGQIKLKVADNESLLGTASDTGHLVMFEFAKLVNLLSTASTIKEINQAAAQAKTTLGSFLENVEQGKTSLPYQSKGLTTVLNEIETRADGVSKVLSK